MKESKNNIDRSYERNGNNCFRLGIAVPNEERCNAPPVGTIDKLDKT